MQRSQTGLILELSAVHLQSFGGQTGGVKRSFHLGELVDTVKR
jgi:hypothetical protein